jgi:hypothetical protein
MIEEVKGFAIELKKEDVCHLLGYRDGGQPTASISSLIDEELKEARQLIEASSFYQLMDVEDVSPPTVVLDNGMKITVTGEILSWVLSPCQLATVFVSSIGLPLENRVTELLEEGEVLRGYLLDAIGSTAANAAAFYLRDRIRDLAKSEGAEITFRCSPGYCDWDIAEQRVLFEVMDSAQTGVELSDDCLMTPRKSVSGLIGVGWGDKERIGLTPCHLCTKRDCPSRR